MTDLGRKDDAEKLDWSLLPIAPTEEIVRVLMYGAQKYAPDNWKHVPDPERRYWNAAMRHLTAWQRGERFDPESGLNHLAHAACSVLFLLHFTGFWTAAEVEQVKREAAKFDVLFEDKVPCGESSCGRSATHWGTYGWRACDEHTKIGDVPL